MNRRRFLISSVGLIPLVPGMVRSLAQESTPEVAVSLPDLPADITPVPITDDVDLLYFRAVQLGSHIQLLGELRNNADYWVSSPLLILSSDTGLKAQPAMLHGDIPPGGREQFSHGFYELTDKERAEALTFTVDSVEQELCDIGPLGIYNDQLELQAVTDKMRIDLDRAAFRATVKVTNLGSTPTHYVYASALFFDEERFFCGSLTSRDNARLRVDQEVQFEIEEGFDSFSTAGNPLELISQNPTVVIQAGWFQPGFPICI